MFPTEGPHVLSSSPKNYWNDKLKENEFGGGGHLKRMREILNAYKISAGRAEVGSPLGRRPRKGECL